MRIPLDRQSWITILGAAFLASCATTTVEPTLTSLLEPAPQPTPIPEPTPTPIPHVLFVRTEPVGWEDEAKDWVLERGWHLNAPDDLPTASTYLLESGLPRMAISVGEALDGDLEQAASGGLLVVAVDVPGLEPGPTLSTVEPARLDQAGFLAGVMTGLASDTGWVGEVTHTGGADEAAYRVGFMQGLLWGCPKCQLISQPASEMTLDRFRANTVDAVFTYPGPEAHDAAELLSGGSIPVVWVGDNGPPAEMLVGRIAIDEGFTVLQALEDIVQTGEGRSWQPSIETWSIVPEDVNPDLLSPGRQRLLEEAFFAIAAGELDIGTTPER